MNKTFKMDSALALCNSLIKWLQSLQIPGPQNSALDLTDGVAVANACTQISPEYFNQDWVSKIKPDVGTNWRLKVSNLKKIVEKIIEFYQDELNLNILDGAKPDCTKIGETADQMELGKLLQLVLGAAVNCENKQEYYITRIMSMEESVQQSIMQAIQSLDEATRGRGPFSITDISDMTKIQRLTAELDRVNQAKEVLAQRCHELELQVQCLTEEKSTIQTENQRLQHRLEDTASPEEPSQNMELRKQVTELRATLFKLEATRDDNSLKIEELELQISVLQGRIEELQFEAGNAKQLKDEVDALTATAEKVQTMELSLASYKKKLEDYANLKKQLKQLEAKNTEYFEQNLNLEEEIKKGLSLKSQIEVYKKQLEVLNKQLDEEMGKGVKLEFEKTQLEAKIKVLERERQVLITERDSVKDLNEELRIEAQPTTSTTSVAKELAVPELRERLNALEVENRNLRGSVATSELLEEWNEQQEELRSQLKASNQKILEQEAKLAEVNRLVTSKEIELQSCKEQYKRNLEKAREVIGSMHLRGGEERCGGGGGGQMKESEARLLTSAFLNLGEACQREAVDARLALLSAGQGQTFLSRQRHPTPRKSINSRLK